MAVACTHTLHVAPTHKRTALALTCHPVWLAAVLQGGKTPLHMAAQAGHKEVAQKLVDAGAVVDAVFKVRNAFTPFTPASRPLHF
jgi:hypothetical protein